MAYPFPFVAGNILTAAELNALSTLGTSSLGFQSGQYYAPPSSGNVTLTPANQLVHYVPFYVSTTTTFDRIAVRTATGFSGTATVRLGIYNNDAATGKPSTVNLDAGTVSCTATGVIYTITINKSLNAGWYWLAFCTQGAAATNNFQGKTIYQTAPFANKFDGLNAIVGYTQSGVSGAFATAGTLTNIDSNLVTTFLRAA